jgi:predicted dehydrogenase
LAARKFGVGKVYGSHKELVADPDVDAVVVVTRPQAHGPIVLDALEAGRHVLSEKPMAHTLAQATRLVEAAERHNLCYAVGYMKRHDAGAQQAKAMLDQFRQSGELGAILLVRAYCYGGEFRCGTSDFVMTDEARPDGLSTWPKGPDWMPKERHDEYASFLNVFVHDLNIMRFLLGAEPMVRSVDMDRKNGRLATFDFGEFSGILEMAETAAHDWTEGVDIVFEKGRLSLQFLSPLLRNQPARVELTRSGAQADTVLPRVEWSWAFRRQAEAFISDIAAGRKPLASGRDALNDLGLAESIWRTMQLR